MNIKNIPIFVAALLFMGSCSNQGRHGGEDGKIVIKYSDFKEVQVDSPFEMIESEPRFVRLSSGENNSFGFSGIDRIEILNNKIYILDNSHYRLLVFEDSGAPAFKLDLRGRGPNEYLQISDFDVDEDGTIWVADAQKNRMFKYSSEGVMQKSLPYVSEITMVCCLGDGQFLIGLGNWDNSEFAGTALALSDSAFAVKTPILPFPKNTDSNFEFNSVFSRGEEGVFYNWPIDDNLYEISYDGTLRNTYYFDFGEKTVPDKWRRNVEPILPKLLDYCFLVNTFQVTSDYVVCGIRINEVWNSVIMDREKKTMACFEPKTSGYNLVGQYPSGSIWQINSNCEMDNLPSEVQEWLDNDDDVLVLIPFK